MVLTILVGTMTGTAQLVAEEVRDALAPLGVEAEVVLMDDMDGGVFARAGKFLVCTSTYGQGDVPDNARGLLGALKRDKPDLSHVEYGLIALGDRTYADTFCFGGARFDEALRALGARPLGEALRHDAGTGTIPEEVAVDWAKHWVEGVRAAQAA